MLPVMTVSLLLGMALAAGAREPVVWTKMADPDPTYVAPKATKPKRAPAKAGAVRASEPDNLEGAVENLMEVARDHDEAAIRDYERQIREAEATIERARQITEQAEAREESAPQR